MNSVCVLDLNHLVIIIMNIIILSIIVQNFRFCLAEELISVN